MELYIKLLATVGAISLMCMYLDEWSCIHSGDAIIEWTRNIWRTALVIAVFVAIWI